MLGALKKLPVKSEAIHSTEDISLIIVTNNIDVFLVIHVEMAVVNIYGEIVDSTNFSLTLKDLA